MSRLDLDGVWHRYAGAAQPALRDVSLAVEDGSLVSVVGPSGSGKSTVLRVAAGLERAERGTVRVDGRDVAGLPTERRDLTVMFQQPLLFDHLDVAGNVAFAPRLAGAGRAEARRRAARYLSLVHLEGVERRSVSTLSGGQQQRVALARALAAERGALLLDEPFSSLDRELRTVMHDLLAEVRAALEPTIALVTHDLDEAALADSTAVLIDGVVHQQAPMPELYRRPGTLAVARLLGGFTEVPGTVVDGVHRSSWGEVALDPAVAAGSGVLLLRREALHLVDPASAPADAAAAGVRARVARRRPLGTRTVVTLDAEDGTVVEVELSPGSDARVGDRVRVALGDRATPWAVPTGADLPDRSPAV